MLPTTPYGLGPYHGHYPAFDTVRPCGHVRHFGPCSSCQRVQLSRWKAQLAPILGEGQAR